MRNGATRAANGLARILSKRRTGDIVGGLIADAQCFLRSVRALENDFALRNLFHLKIAHAVADVDGLAAHDGQRLGGVENDALDLW